MTFTRMDESTAEQWHDIFVETIDAQPQVADHVLAMLRSYVRADVTRVIETHQDFQGRHYYEHLGMDPNLRRNHHGEPWYDLAVTFADEWDQTSFDPDYPTKPLAHFEPAVRQVFDHPHSL
jgi:predicted HD phosphohydrolase